MTTLVENGDGREERRFDFPDSLRPLPHSRLWIGGHNTTIRAVIDRALAGYPRPPTGAIDAAYITPRTPDEAAYFAGKVASRVTLGGTIWIVHSCAMSKSADGKCYSFEEYTNQIRSAGLELVADRTQEFGDYVALLFMCRDH